MRAKYSILLLLVLLGFNIRSGAQLLACPPNIDFEFGDFTNWHCFIGSFSTGMSMLAATPTACAPTVNRHDIMTGAGTDPYGGFPIVAPGGGTYSVRLGKDITGQLAERIRYYVRIPPGSASFDLVYKYAVVLENPGHTPPEQPRFEVDATDSITGLPIPCGSYSYVSTSGLPGFTLSSIGSDVYYNGWSTATLNLSGLGGTTVAIDFGAADCSLGGHFGYGYVDMTCGLFQVSGLNCNDTTSPVTLSAPLGFHFYQWYDSLTFTHSYGTTQVIVIPPPSGPTTIAVVLTPYPGYGCPDTLYAHLAPSNLQLAPSHDTLLCVPDSLTLTSGATDIALPLTYVWSGPGIVCATCSTTRVFPGLGTTVYTVSVTNPVGCTKDTTIKVIIDNLSVPITKQDDTCHNSNNGWATANVTTGVAPISYLWSTTPPQTTATATGLYGNGPGGSITYSVTVVDNIGCSASNSVTIFDGQPTDLYIVSATNPDSCDIPDGFIILDSLVPGQTFTVSYLFNGVPQIQTVVANASWQATLSRLGRGTYSNIGIVTAHCPYNTVGPVVLVDPPAIPIPPTSSTTVCVGRTLNLTTSSVPGVAYSWTGPGGFTSALQNPTIYPAVFADSGIYKVIVSKVNCFDSNWTRVQIVPSPVPSASNNAPICSGDTLRLFSSSSTGASYYIWNGPNGFYANTENPVVPNALAAGTGTYTVSVVLGICVDTATTDVLVKQTPDAPLVTDTGYCQRDVPAPLSANATGSNLLWYTNASGGTGSSIAPVPTTVHTGLEKWYVTQTVNGCESPRAPITAQIDSLTFPYLTVTDTVICRGGDITFNLVNSGDNTTSTTWSFGDGHQYNNVYQIIHAFTGIGVFTVTATANYRYCPEKIFNKTVVVMPSPNVYLGVDTSICPGGAAIILTDKNNNNTAGAEWKWNTGDTHAQIRVTTPGTYYVKVTIDGCASTDTIVVAKDCYLDIPNVFSPNGDGMNDYFFPRLELTKGLVTFSMEIYNRWGQQIFSSSSLDGRGWDGRFNDIPQPEGVYVYVIDATFKDGQKEHHQGNITLLR